ncbi:MAG: patatin-like phospholipase family protein [Arthrobacter sp.]
MVPRTAKPAQNPGAAMIRVLSIDGGGIRGIMPATWLMALEEQTGKPVAELFDLVVGTSTGGILALGLTSASADGKPHSAAELRSLYVDHGAEIFPGTGTAGTEGSTGTQARYPAEPLRRLLNGFFGAMPLSAALKPVAVVTVDIRNLSGLLFSGGGLGQDPLGDAPMQLAALATSSAPTYFDPVPYTGPDGVERLLVDGGLAANDPAFVGFAIAVVQQRTARQGEEILLVSMGTGLHNSGNSLESNAVSQLAHPEQLAALEPVIESLYGAPGRLTRRLLGLALGERYVRVQTPLLPGVDHALDDASPENIDGLLRTAEAVVAAGHLQDLGVRLTAESPD